MKIEKSEYENLVRDSEKLRMIETLALRQKIICTEEILAMCGYAPEECKLCTTK